MILVINKVDEEKHRNMDAEFTRLGIGKMDIHAHPAERIGWIGQPRIFSVKHGGSHPERD